MVLKYSDFLVTESTKVDFLDDIKLIYEMISDDKDIQSIEDLFKKSLIILKDEMCANLESFKINEFLEEIKSLNPNITRELNIYFFFRTIQTIIELKKEDTVIKVKYKFDKYINSLKKRISRALACNKTEDKQSDDVEEDVSVLDRREFTSELRKLQIEMNKLMEWVVKENEKVVILFDGRDGSGKGSTINTITEYMNPKHFKIVTNGIPTPEQMDKENWFDMYKSQLPTDGKIYFFDRSWYNMGINNPTMGYCTDEQYTYFMENVNRFERDLIVNDNYTIIKFWFSIDKEKQQQRFQLRINSPLKYWKYSPNDAKASEKWDVFTKYKNQCFAKTSTKICPWVVVQSGDKKTGQLNALRYILNKINYDGKDKSNIGEIYHDIVHELK